MARKRRGRGESSIYQRADDGLWVGSVSLGYAPDGRRKRRTVYGKTKKEAQDELDRLRNESRAGALPDAGKLTTGHLLDRWLEALKAKVSTRRYERQESLIRLHLKPCAGGVKLAKLGAVHVEALAAELRADKVRPWAARHALDTLATACRYAVKLKLIALNPCDATDRPTPKSAERHYLTAEQAKLVREVSAGMPVGPLLAVALGSGARQGELLALRWDDVDLKAGTIQIRRSLALTAKAGFEVKEPKTASGRRTVVLPPFAVAALTDLKASAMAAGLLAAPVFCTRTGNYLNKNNCLRAFRNVVGKVNAKLAETDGAKLIPANIRFHDMRHSHASMLLSAGHSLRAVSQRLGHANPALTLRVYAHCLPGDDGKLAEGLHSLVG